MKTNPLITLLVLLAPAAAGVAWDSLDRPQAQRGVAEAEKHDRSGPDGDVRKGYSIFRETLVELPWPEVKRASEAGALVLLPIGVIEEHGPHMGLGADTYLAYRRCSLLRERLKARGVTAVIAPPMFWGVMQTTETGAYPGSFTVRPSTMKALLLDMFTDLERWGFRHVHCVNHHGDRVHRRTIEEAISEAQQRLRIGIFDAGSRAGWKPDLPRYSVAEPFQPDFHAGASETSEMLKHFPEEVDTAVARTLKPQRSFHPQGYVGDPANFRSANAGAFENGLDSEADEIAAWMAETKPF